MIKRVIHDILQFLSTLLCCFACPIGGEALLTGLETHNFSVHERFIGTKIHYL